MENNLKTIFNFNLLIIQFSNTTLSRALILPISQFQVGLTGGVINRSQIQQ